MIAATTEFKKGLISWNKKYENSTRRTKTSVFEIFESNIRIALHSIKSWTGLSFSAV